MQSGLEAHRDLRYDAEENCRRLTRLAVVPAAGLQVTGGFIETDGNIWGSSRGSARLNGPVGNGNTGYRLGIFKRSLTSYCAKRQSVSLRISEMSSNACPVELRALSDPAVRVCLNRILQIDHRCDGRWRGMKYGRGKRCIVLAGQARLLRLAFKGQTTAAPLTLILPQNAVHLVAEEVSVTGKANVTPLNEILFLDDPVISSFNFSVAAALRGGAPEVCAQSAAQSLAAHVLLGPSRCLEWRHSVSHERISDYRLTKVMEYIAAHVPDRLDICVLSRETGISPFHFPALFSKAAGGTPHRHVLHLRMPAARLIASRFAKAEIPEEFRSVSSISLIGCFMAVSGSPSLPSRASMVRFGLSIKMESVPLCLRRR